MSTYRMDELRRLTTAAFLDRAVMFARRVRSGVDAWEWEGALGDAWAVAKERGAVEALEAAIELDRKGGVK